MRLIEIADRKQWDAFQVSQPYAQFTQSWVWGEFAIAQGRPVKRYALVSANGTWHAAVQMEYRKRRLGTGYWFAPRGPVFAPTLSGNARREAMADIVGEFQKLPGLRQRALFWRMEPVSAEGDPKNLLPPSFCRAPAMNPASTILLDLAPSEDELLRRMHEKTRYNIRVAERHGVQTRIGGSEADVAAFLRLMGETASRDGFAQHPSAYLKATFAFLHERGTARIRLAEFEGRAVAANMEVLYGDTVTYLYGASSSDDRNIMAPHLLHWDAIREAKRGGQHLYDFWGANPESKGAPGYKPSWEGITRFKQGYGGRTLDLVGTWDLPFNLPLYRLAFLRQYLGR